MVSDANPDLWRRSVRGRLLVVAAVFVAWVAVIEARLAYLQVYRHDYYVARAEQQQSDTIRVPAPRGDVLDRNGRVLAISVPADSLFVVPREVPEASRPRVVAAICEALDSCDREFREALLQRMRNPKTQGFVWARRRLTPEEKQRVLALKLRGINFEKESRRLYPNVGVASHLLGYVGLDNVGLGGIERSFDREISGTPGKSIVQTDARHDVFSRSEQPPQPGASVELTIDRNIQFLVEAALAAGVREHRAAGGTAIVMDPWTAEVLAMASLPTFNPNMVSEAEPAALRNRAIEDVYEPGSTFKTVTASAALEEGVCHPGDLFNTDPGYIRIGNWRVVRDTHRNGVVSFTEGIVKSSNVLAIKVGQKVGAERMSRYVLRFGFGQKLLPDLKGESPGIVWSKYNESALASVSMGYQIGVTPLQMVTAVSSVANGGHLMQPRLVRAIIRNGQRTVIAPRELRRTISEATALTLTGIMEGVVAEGTGRTARIEGYTIAGKTGTAAKLVDGAYSKQKYNASFVGFFPSRKPKYAILVVIDSPSTGPYYGGVVAAPVFKKIGEGLIALEGVPRSVDPPDTLLVKNRVESPARPASQTSRDILRAVASQAPDTLPDLRGLSMREAVRVLVSLGVETRLSGSGVVVGQSPDAGTPLADTRRCELTLARVPPDPAPAPVEETEERP
jgi:cell division protein FtsI/penicillin-binding protein 2